AAGVGGGLAMFSVEVVFAGIVDVVCGALRIPQPKQEIVELARHARGSDAALFALTAVVLAPFAEEVFFRGLLLPVATRVAGVRWGLVLQAAAFGALHVVGDWRNAAIALPLAVVGWFSGRLYLRTGSLAVCIVMHAT